MLEREERRVAAARLQACVKGYLARRRLQRLRSKYESIVKDIEGSLDQFQWSGDLLPRPVFLPKHVQKPGTSKELASREAHADRPHDQNAKLCQELLPSKQARDFGVQFPDEVAERHEDGDLRQSLEQQVDALCSLPGEKEDGRDPSNVSSEWSSTILGAESPRLSQELPFSKVPEMPRKTADLQGFRKHLAMELLWLQQAIVSRKKYLILKQSLENPN